MSRRFACCPLCRQLLWRATLLEAHPPPPANESPALHEVVAACLAAKESAGRRPKYLRQLGWTLGKFAAGREKLPVSEIKLSDVEAWLASVSKSQSVTKNAATRLSALFSFALRRGWVSSNPIERIEPMRIEHASPPILSPEQAESLLRLAQHRHSETLPYVILGLLAGLRPDEAAAMLWESISLTERTLVVDAATSKVRRRRVVALRDAAHAWLSICAQKQGPASAPRLKLLAFRREAEGLLGRPWPQDVLRHTCASYLLAEVGDAGKVANELGNSEGVLHRHYKALVSREDARRFWALRPCEVLGARPDASHPPTPGPTS